MFRRTSMIICDLQKRPFKKIYGCHKIERNINLLLDCHREYCKIEKNVDPRKILVAEFLPDKLGSTLESVIEKIENYPENLIVKDDYSVYQKNLLNPINDQIILTGIQTEWCIAQTAKDFSKNGYQVNILKDACGSTSLDEHQSAIERLSYLPGINVMTTHNWIAENLRGHYDPISKWYVNQLKETIF